MPVLTPRELKKRVTLVQTGKVTRESATDRSKWSEWLKLKSFVLIKGEDYDITTKRMNGRLRMAGTVYRLKLSIKPVTFNGHEMLFVNVLGNLPDQTIVVPPDAFPPRKAKPVPPKRRK